MRLGACLTVVAAVALVACGGSSSTAGASSPLATVLPGIGTNWQVVAMADDEVVGLALDSHGHLYAVETFANKIAEFSLQGASVTTWGSPGAGPGQFNQPIRVALDRQGDVYVTDNGNSRVQKFTADGKPLAQWGSRGSGPGQFGFPVGIAIDSQGNVWVADFANTRIHRFSPNGEETGAWGGPGEAPGQLIGGPSDIAFDAKGNFYITEANGGNRVHEFTSSGSFVRRWGGSGVGNGQFNEPRGLAFDKQGNIFVGDNGNNRVQKFNATGSFIAAWNGPTAAHFTERTDIAIDDKGYVYVSDGKLILRTCVAASCT